MTLRPSLIASLVALTASTAVSAQDRSPYEMPEEYRDVQARQLESQRNLLVAMADSMPERLYRDRATPAQRDFAQQIFHAAGAVYGIAGRAILEQAPPALPDTSVVLNSRAEMVGFLNEVYDWAIAELHGQAAEARNEIVSLFGLRVPRWQVWDEIHQHTIWTAGQIVANFRKHGMAPPGFAFF